MEHRLSMAMVPMVGMHMMGKPKRVTQMMMMLHGKINKEMTIAPQCFLLEPYCCYMSDCLWHLTNTTVWFYYLLVIGKKELQEFPCPRVSIVNQQQTKQSSTYS